MDTYVKRVAYYTVWGTFQVGLSISARFIHIERSYND